jgi:hypothetical protein
MKAYSVFIVAPEKELKEFKLGKFEFPKCAELNVLGRREFNFDVRVMLRSHLVVTVGDWHEDEKCTKAVQVARIMGQEVIHETKYRAYVESKYN